MYSKKYIYLLLVHVLLLIGCSPVNHRFSPRTNLNETLITRLVNADTATQQIRLYRTVFREQLIEKNNVLEYSVINDSSKKERVTYKEFIGYWQEIYLFQLSSARKKESVVYFSVRYRCEINKETRKPDTVCIGFGPSYLGTLYPREKEYVIHFERTLKPVKSNGRYELDMKKRTDLKFIISKSDFSTSKFRVSRIVSAENNKIGGDKNLVYDTQTIFSDKLGLTFYYVRSFAPK